MFLLIKEILMQKNSLKNNFLFGEREISENEEEKICVNYSDISIKQHYYITS